MSNHGDSKLSANRDRHSQLVLGIDTGGTYTDGILMDYTSRRVLATHKRLTTKRDLSLGIEAVIKGKIFDILVSTPPALAGVGVQGKRCIRAPTVVYLVFKKFHPVATIRPDHHDLARYGGTGFVDHVGGNFYQAAARCGFLDDRTPGMGDIDAFGRVDTHPGFIQHPQGSVIDGLDLIFAQDLQPGGLR